MLNNNGGQGYQVEDYFKSEAYLHGLKNDLRNQGTQLKQQGNNLAAWQSAYRAMEHALAQWQQSHEQQAQEIASLNQRYARLVAKSDEAVESWKKYSGRLKDDNSNLQARINDQQKVIDSLQLARINQPAPPAPVTDEVQATITALQELNTQLQAQVVSMETDLRLEDESHQQQLAGHARTSIFVSAVTDTLSELITEPGAVRDQIQIAFKKHYAIHLEMAMEMGLVQQGLPADPLFYERFPNTAALINCLLDKQATPALTAAVSAIDDLDEQLTSDESDEDYMP